ncbi:MAG: hypothetical protein L0H55_11440 [Candidatus Nitrosocosmicus sp.]|nr:hypothetical protein [Candidatus Nitrosocosmicus sp.]
MNIIENEIPYLVEARTCGCNERGKSVSYHFIESSHSLCVDKVELMLGQIQACERLLKLAQEDGEIVLLKDEISNLKLALEMIQNK